MARRFVKGKTWIGLSAAALFAAGLGGLLAAGCDSDGGGGGGTGPSNEDGFVEIPSTQISAQVRCLPPTQVIEISSDVSGWRGTVTVTDRGQYDVVAPNHLDYIPNTERELVILEAGLTRIPGSFPAGAQVDVLYNYSLVASMAIGTDGSFTENLALTPGDGDPAQVYFSLEVANLGFEDGEDAVSGFHALFDLGVRVDSQGRGVCSYPRSISARLPAEIPLADTDGFLELIFEPELLWGIAGLSIWVDEIDPQVPIFDELMEITAIEVEGTQYSRIHLPIDALDLPAWANLLAPGLKWMHRDRERDLLGSMLFGCYSGMNGGKDE